MIIKLSHSHWPIEEKAINEHAFDILERYFLMRYHPRKIVFDVVGAIWGIYFLWMQNWLAALTIVLVMELGGLYFTRNIIPELMAQSTLGKIGLLHTHPYNLALNIIGMIPFVYGLWMHSIEMTLVGLSAIFMGHFFGWSTVNSKLRIL